MSDHAIELGDVVEVLRDYADNVFDAVLCDPPYGLSFMGKRWDYDVPSAELWREVLRVCKPGAPLIAFSGTRTYHRTVVQIEDAGFEIRDCIAWMYGSGFPKSLDVSKAIDAKAGAVREVVGSKVYGDGHVQRSSESMGFGGCDPAADTRKQTAPATDAARLWHGYGTALKPAFEPAVLARKPLDGTVAENVARWGVGALAIDASRIGSDDLSCVTSYGNRGTAGGFGMGLSTYKPNEGGRWPANVILDEEAGAALDEQTGIRPSTPYRANTATGAVLPMTTRTAGGYSDTGGASRFFKGIECDPANIAEPLSSLPSLLAAFARSAAAISARLEGKQSSDLTAHSTAVMQSGSALSGERSTSEIRSIGERFLLESRRTAAFLTGLATDAEPSEQTAITKTIRNLLRCAFSVESATYGCTLDDSGPGDRVYRFRYCAKASRGERDLGCEDMPERSGGDATDREDGSDGLNSPRAGAGRGGGSRNHHPTVKPLALTEYLARLIMPPNPGAILVPFAGSGSEMIGALRAGWPAVVGIERESAYVEIARRRLRAA